jgi:hypothetical protein
MPGTRSLGDDDRKERLSGGGLAGVRDSLELNSIVDPCGYDSPSAAILTVAGEQVRLGVEPPASGAG